MAAGGCLSASTAEVSRELAQGRRARARAANVAADGLIRKLVVENLALKASPPCSGLHRDIAIVEAHQLHLNSCLSLQMDCHFGPDASHAMRSAGLIATEVLQQQLVVHARGALARHAALFTMPDAVFGALTNTEIMKLVRKHKLLQKFVGSSFANGGGGNRYF